MKLRADRFRTLDDCVDYLDDAIKMWRLIRDNPHPILNEEGAASERRTAACYIDAYQCVRTWITGEILP